MAHMQATIDFYIKFNKQPTLADLHRYQAAMRPINSNGLQTIGSDAFLHLAPVSISLDVGLTQQL